jgi:hypothetical protein
MGPILPLVACFYLDFEIAFKIYEKRLMLHLVIASHSSLSKVLNQKVTFVTAEKMTNGDRCNWTIKANNL